MSWHFCTSESAVAKAGTHCNAISGSAVTMAKWSDEAEGFIMVKTNTDFSGSYSILEPAVKGILSDVASSMIAKRIIVFDTTGYISREADTLMNMNDDIENRGLKVLEGKPNQLKTP